MNIVTLDARPVNSWNNRNKPRTTGDLIDKTPLPKKYRHLTPLLRNVPAHDVASCILACIHVGFSDDQVADALRRLGEHHQIKDHRCSTCLSWTNDALFGGFVNGAGQFAIVTICVRCQRMIVTGRATPTMERNLVGYGLGLDEVLR